MKKCKIVNVILLVVALTMVTSMTAFAYTNKDFAFSFVTSGTQDGLSEPNQKTDLEDMIYVTTTGGTVSSATPVYFSVYRTNWYDETVSNHVLVSSNNYRMITDYWAGPFLDNWYQLYCITMGYTVSVEGRWCP